MHEDLLLNRVGHDFWPSCGYRLLEQDADGHLLVTDAFLRYLLERPELAPIASSCSAEIALHDALVEVVPQADAAFVTGDYAESLTALAALRTPVDAFFDGVMVNADDPALRANRLGLLAKLHAAMNQVADLSKLSA